MPWLIAGRMDDRIRTGMKILYISGLSNNLAAGPNWSVPAGIKAQERIDDVLWINLTEACLPHWQEVKAYHNIKEYGLKFVLDILPDGFRRPDLVVFEGFYMPEHTSIARRLRRECIPYVIVPRGSLTRRAQRGGCLKRLKKAVANLLMFKPYTRGALAIQYLTEAERSDSGVSWNIRSFVVPNGFTTPAEYKSSFSVNGLRAVFIGRLDMYHKGLDVLLDACAREHAFLREHGVTLSLYGPRRYDFERIGEYVRHHGIGDIVTMHDEIAGDEKRHVLLDSDLFVLTSRFEGHPMGLIEALAYGVPALVSPGSNMADEIAAADAGWVCDAEAGSVAAALRRIVREKETLPAKSAGARRLSLAYDWDSIARDFHEKTTALLRQATV